MDLVGAQTDSARRNAALGLSRALGERLDRIQSDVTQAYAALQASLDYPEEGVPEAELEGPLAQALRQVEELLATAEAGRISRHGARLALLGRPNAGKSSLLNALLGFERSIVSATPGTTRDYLEAPLSLGGIPLTAIDTAGIRNAEDAVEASGVRIAKQIAEASDLCLLLLDRSVPLDPDDLALTASCHSSGRWCSPARPTWPPCGATMRCRYRSFPCPREPAPASTHSRRGCASVCWGTPRARSCGSPTSDTRRLSRRCAPT